MNALRATVSNARTVTVEIADISGIPSTTTMFTKQVSHR